MKRPIEIFVDRDETLKMRRRDNESAGGKGSIVATFDSPLSLYRVMDGEELRRIYRSRKIVGGFFATLDERKYGASWGENISKVISWGISHSKGTHARLGQDLFLAKIDAYHKLFYHMQPNIEWDPNSPTQVYTMDASECSTGLGCSVYGVIYPEATFYRIDPSNEQITQLNDEDIRRYAEARPMKAIETRVVAPGIYSHGTIHGIDVYIVLDQNEGAYYHTWSVIDRNEHKIVRGARTEKIAVTKAADMLRHGYVPADTLELLPKYKKVEWARREADRQRWGRLMKNPATIPVEFRSTMHRQSSRPPSTNILEHPAELGLAIFGGAALIYAVYVIVKGSPPAVVVNSQPAPVPYGT